MDETEKVDGTDHEHVGETNIDSSDAFLSDSAKSCLHDEFHESEDKLGSDSSTSTVTAKNSSDREASPTFQSEYFANLQKDFEFEKSVELVNPESSFGLSVQDSIDREAKSENFHLDSRHPSDPSLLVNSSNVPESTVDVESQLQEQNCFTNVHISDQHSISDRPLNVPLVKKIRRRRYGFSHKINATDDPETVKEKRRKYDVELKLKNLKWTLNQPSEVSGPRQKRPPQRLDLGHPERRTSASFDLEQGRGEPLGSIPWIVQQVKEANIYTLRLLHRIIFRKQGMFSEKHIRASVLTFRGFPFDENSPELAKRRMPLEKANINVMSRICDVLGIKCSSREAMIHGILKFLLNPNRAEVEEFLKEVSSIKNEKSKIATSPQRKSSIDSKIMLPSPEIGNFNDDVDTEESSSSSSEMPETGEETSLADDIDITNAAWKKPSFFIEGVGMKLKHIKPIISNILLATDNFIELLHKVMFLHTDEKYNMRRNVLEFSGFKCDPGTNDYMWRSKLLTMLPLEQIKFVCRILCLPTWHRSRQMLVEGIMDFLVSPRVSVLKKRLPSNAPEEISPVPEAAPKYPGPAPPPPPPATEVKNVESEEIEIFPDIHIPDDGSDCVPENSEENAIKLKQFPNIHYQVISTPAAKLNDAHTILYLRPCPPNTVRKNILEFSGFPFSEHSAEYQCRRALMEQMTLDSLNTVATVFCISEYIVDKSRNNIIEAVLKFLLKPGLLWKDTPLLMPTIPLPQPSQAQPAMLFPDLLKSITKQPAMSPDGRKIYILTPGAKVVENLAFSDNIQNVELPVIVAPPNISQQNLANCSIFKTGGITAPLVHHAAEDKIIKPPQVTQESKDAALEQQTKDTCNEMDEPLAKVQEKNMKSTCNQHSKQLDDDDDDDEPLSKLVGHPSDEQIKILVAKTIKEAKLEDITMKKVIRMVFDAYPNFDLGYRKEFIKSTVRQILSQMDDQSCSVSTTVLTV